MSISKTDGKKADQGLERYQERLLHFSTKYIEPAWTAHVNKVELPERLDSTFFTTVFSGYMEITKTIDALKMCQTLIRVSPPRSKSIMPDDYFKFLIGAYLQEMYILDQRLSSYAKRVSRMYKKPMIISIVKEHILEPLDGVIRTRGVHVHEQRYSDKELDMLATYTLFSRSDAKFADHLKDHYMFAQLEWGKRVKSNNATISILVDRYFDILYPVVTKNDNFFLPRTGRGRSALSES